MAKAKDPLLAMGLTKKDVNRLYIQAKMIASPHDYSFKDRAILESDQCRYSTLTDTFYLGSSVEDELCYRLGATKPAEIRLLECKHLLGKNNTYDYGDYDESRDGEATKLWLANPGLAYKHNDLIINSANMARAMAKAGYSSLPSFLILIELINSSDAIFPMLALTRMDTAAMDTLDEVANVKFAEAALDNGQYMLSFGPMHAMPAWTVLQMAYANHGNMYSLGKDPHLDDPDFFDAYAEAARQNVMEYGMFACEVVRAFNSMRQEDRAAIGPSLFELEQGQKGSNFMEAFGSYDPLDFRFKSAELDAICQMRADERFKEIQKYARQAIGARFAEVFLWDKVCFKPDMSAIAFPETLLNVLSDMHFKAWEDFRTRYFALLLRKCREKGVDISDLRNSADGSGAGISQSGSQSSTAVRDFGDMSQGTDYGSGDLDAKAGDPLPEKREAIPPQLETVANLLKTCDPKWSITVAEAKNDQGLKEAYRRLLTPIDRITKQLTKQIRDIKTYNFGGKNPGKSKGKLDPHTMYRYKTDPKIFYDTTYKIREMDLAFGILLDQSGSMSGDGIYNGMISLIMLHHVLNALRVNHAIAGHNSHNYNSCKITKYVSFNEDPKHTLETPYMLANLKASGGNCDAAALNYMEQYILRARNKDKIVIIFNDGEPSECDDADLKAQVRKMEREGIHVIGLGVNFENIKLYYPDAANGRNLKEMVDILVGILKRYVLEKKD